MKKYLPFALLFIGAASIWFIKSHQIGSLQKTNIEQTTDTTDHITIVPSVDSIEADTGHNVNTNRQLKN